MTTRDPFLDLTDLAVTPPSVWHGLQGWLVRMAAKGALPLRGFWPEVDVDPTPRRGRLSLEVVSHCWGYAHLLECQLGSLVAHPPLDVDVTMTVYFCREDAHTTRLLELCAERQVPNVTWSWRALPKGQLFRRSIGRNHAALTTTADWVWFTDCDVLFGSGNLDGLAEVLQGRTDPLVYPAVELLTDLLPDDELYGEGDGPELRDPTDDHDFVAVPVTRAKGPLQITHGDVARTAGYCRDVAAYQREEPAFAKCHEDKAFRWLLGTDGVPVTLPHGARKVSRLRHLSKGRYGDSAAGTRVRSSVRRLQERLRHPS